MEKMGCNFQYGAYDLFYCCSPQHLFFARAIINERKICNFCLIWTGSQDAFLDVCGMLNFDIDKHVIFIEFSKLKTPFLFLLNHRFFKNKIKKFLTNPDHFFVGFNAGPVFQLVMTALNISHDKVYLFDDGIGNLVDLHTTHFLYKKIFYDLFLGLSPSTKKKHLTSDSSLKNMITIFPEIISKKYPQLRVFDIRKSVLDVITSLGYFQDKMPKNSALILSSGLIEQNRVKPQQFWNTIDRVIERLNNKGIEKIFVKFHYAEDEEKSKEYQKRGCEPISSSNIPIEFSLRSLQPKILVTPYNSTIPIGLSLGLLSPENYLIYEIPQVEYQQKKDLVNKCYNIKELVSFG